MTVHIGDHITPTGYVVEITVTSVVDHCGDGIGTEVIEGEDSDERRWVAIKGVWTLIGPTALADHALCEQHPQASAALPDQACAGYVRSGVRWIACTAPAEWDCRGKRRWLYCTWHAARRLRRWDAMARRDGAS